jgi:hypothetical protein
MTTAPVVAAPNIYLGRYLRQSGLQRLSVGGRLLALGLAVGCLTLLVMATGLAPAVGGFGTHRQLGLQECGFLLRTGLPCPACGMTTSFAWFARGNIAASFYVQPMGCVLAFACAFFTWAGAYAAITAKPIHQVFSVIPEKLYLIPLFTFAMVGWGWKIFIHLHGMDGWK